MRIEFVLSDKEIEENIPYKIICNTRYGSVWNTMHRKKRWMTEFSIVEQEAAEEFFRQTHKWYTKGVPNNVRIEYLTLELWNKIAEFCFTL